MLQMGITGLKLRLQNAIHCFLSVTEPFQLRVTYIHITAEVKNATLQGPVITSKTVDPKPPCTQMLWDLVLYLVGGKNESIEKVQ